MPIWKRFEVTPKTRRVMVLKVSYDIFLHLLMPDGKSVIRQKGIPKDARLIAMYDEPETACICFLIASKQFPKVAESQYPEILSPTYERAWKRGWFQEGK